MLKATSFDREPLSIAGVGQPDDLRRRGRSQVMFKFSSVVGSGESSTRQAGFPTPASEATRGQPGPQARPAQQHLEDPDRGIER